MRMTFGKYKDTDLCEIPIEYLYWVQKVTKNKSLKVEIEYEIIRREEEERILKEYYSQDPEEFS
jgi:hypothetical protein